MGQLDRRRVPVAAAFGCVVGGLFAIQAVVSVVALTLGGGLGALASVLFSSLLAFWLIGGGLRARRSDDSAVRRPCS